MPPRPLPTAQALARPPAKLTFRLFWVRARAQMAAMEDEGTMPGALPGEEERAPAHTPTRGKRGGRSDAKLAKGYLSSEETAVL